MGDARDRRSDAAGPRRPVRRTGAAALFGEGGSLRDEEVSRLPEPRHGSGAWPVRSARTEPPARSRSAATGRSRGEPADRTRAEGATGARAEVRPADRSRAGSRAADTRDLGRGPGSTRPTGRRPDRRPPPPPARPPRPGTGSAGRPRSSGARRLRIGVSVLSALVLVVTGAAWSFYRDVTGGITTTNVITGGSTGGDLNILLVGVDSRTDAQGNPLPPEVLRSLRSGADAGVLNSDTIIVLHLPANGTGATAFSVPRDSYVSIPGYRRDKINAAYPATKALKAQELVSQGVSQRDADQQSSATGRTALIETVQNLTGLQIDHYAEINLLGFATLTDAIGGVEVCLKAPVDDDFSGADFPAGPQTISGVDALAFVRQRHGLPGGDLSRIRRQQVFLAAVADKVLSGGTLTNPGTLNALIAAAQKSLVIDSGWDLLGFAHRASAIAAGDVDFLTIPTQGTTVNERGDVVLVDPTQVKAFVEERTTPRTPAPAAPPPPAVDPATVTVDVGNGSGGTGLAAQVSGRLTGAGYRAGTVENSAGRDTSVVRYPAGGEEAARAVAAELGGLGVEASATVPAGHVQVLLGKDFARTTSTPAPAGTSAATPTPDPVVNAGGVPCVD